MEIKFRSNTAFYWLAVTTWFLFFLTVELETYAKLGFFGSLFFALGASFISYCILQLIGYFDALRIVPRKSDLLLVLFALPVGGIIQCALFRFVSGDPNLCGYTAVVYGAPIFTLFVFGGHYAFTWLLLFKGRRRKIVLDILPFEKNVLLTEFKARGLTECISFLSRRDLEARIRAGKNDIDLVIISRRTVKDFKSNPWLLRAHLVGVPIMDYRSVASGLSGRCRLIDADLWSYVLNARPQTHFLRMYTFMKRVLEPVLAFMLAVVLLPVFVAVALAIKLSSPGPVLYRQVRAGYKGRAFTLLKFRSMRIDSEKNGPQWALQNDDRVTRVGCFIRKTRLDELPQLWNVFKGEMSFCGPRPERPEIYARLEEDIPIFSLRTVVRPGITGWAQVFAGYAASIEESLLKLEYDLYYIQHMSPRLDLIILFQTFWVAIFGDARKNVPESALIDPRTLDKFTDHETGKLRLEAANG